MEATHQRANPQPIAVVVGIDCNLRPLAETLAKQALQIIGDELGPKNIELTLGYVGMIHSNFPVNAVYQWSRGPDSERISDNAAKAFS